MAVPGRAPPRGPSARATCRPSPTPAGAGPAWSAPPTRRRSCWPSSPSTWWCSSSRASAPTPASSTATRLWPDGVHLQHQYYRAFTAMWLHANFLHIFFNMIALLIVGPAVEVLLGKAPLPRPLPDRRARRERRLVPPRPAQRGRHRGVGRHHGRPGRLRRGGGLRRRLPVAPVVVLLVLNLLIGFTGNIDWRAHLGGLVAGAVLAFLYDYAGSLRDRTTELALTVGGSVAVLAVLALLITSIAPGHVNLELSGRLVDSETKIAILFHQWVRQRHDLNRGLRAPRPGGGTASSGTSGPTTARRPGSASSTGPCAAWPARASPRPRSTTSPAAAGLSRATVYRTFPGGKEGILAAVVETEVARLFSSLAVVMGEATDLEDVLVAGMVESARWLRSHERAGLPARARARRRAALPHVRRARPGAAGGRRPGRTVLRPLARARAGVPGGRVGRAHRHGLLLGPARRTPT